MKRVLFSFPTAWDERQLSAAESRWAGEYEVIFDSPRDSETRWDFDILGYVDERARTLRGRLDGVTTSSDYPGAPAVAALASALDLAGSSPAVSLRASHKYYSRLVQRAAVPDATPRFQPLDPADPSTWELELGFPCFVKPVKASFSLFSRLVRDPAELHDFLRSPGVQDFSRHYVRMFDELSARYSPFEIGGRWFLAEERLVGAQVTLEGWVHRGEVGILGIVDSTFHPGTGSFARFDYPSLLPGPVQKRMSEVAGSVVRALGLAETAFNLELLYDERSDSIGIVELNPRLCGQFGDLYEKVDGTNGYEIALALACGRTPEVRRRSGPFAAAASFPLRSFERVRVRHAPAEAEVRAAERAHPGALIWVECREGETLLDSLEAEDGASQRYAVLNLGGADRRELEERRARIERMLAFEFDPSSSESTLRAH